MGTYHGTTDVKKLHYEMGELLDDKEKRKILEEAFERRVGYKLNLDNPQTMNEKIMWLKLYYQDPLITTCADKFAVKGYIKERVGEEYYVPTIASWTDPDEIDFESLPNQFVLKVNWSSGYNIIVKDKASLDIEATKNKLRKWIQPDRNSYYQFFGWGYKHMTPVIYAEEYLEQINGQVYDYKFFFCNGKYEYLFIATDRSNDDTLTYDYYDNNFNHIDVNYGGGKHASPLPQKPKHYDEMVRVATELAKPFPFVRVDFYEVGDRIYVGEMTFYCGGGLLPFNPVEWDYKFGEKIHLPQKLITDKESPFVGLKRASRKIKKSVKDNLTKLRKKLVRKEQIRRRKYLIILGLRLPYETHLEVTPTQTKKFITILGFEFCYKNYPRAKRELNSNIKFEYIENTPLEAFMLEGKITPQMQKIHCEQKGYKQLGYFPNLTNPTSLNEKIMWLALNYKNPDIAVATDKGTAKDWIGSKVGYEHIVPLIGVYDDVNLIDFAKLPDQFVAKLNDGWGAEKVMVVRNKSELNVDQTKAVLSSWLYPWNNYYYQNLCITDEKMLKPTIVIEEYLEDNGQLDLNDYKFYCCNGEPKFALVVTDRGTENQTRSFVDMDWKVLPVNRNGKLSNENVKKPSGFDEMVSMCRKLSNGFPFVRIDFYQANGKVYVGEMTFTPGMFLRFNPRSWDYKLGEYLQLPELTEYNNWRGRYAQRLEEIK